METERETEYKGRAGLVPAATLGLVAGLVILGSSPARAQSSQPFALSVHAGLVEYDLSGTGYAPGLAIRATRALTPRVDLEVGSLFASPNQQFGGSSLLIPEAHVKYRWALGRVSPFVGTGGGVAFDSGSDGWDARPALSFSTGAQVRLNNQSRCGSRAARPGYRQELLGQHRGLDGRPDLAVPVNR